MHTLTLLDRAETAGLRIVREGDRLHVDGPSEAASIVDELGQRKPGILNAWWQWQATRLLRRIEDRETQAALRDLFDEVAAHREIEQGQDVETSELIAFGALVSECLWRGLPVAVTVDRRARA